MNDESFCCNGICNQGDKCPRYRRTEREIFTVIKVVITAIFVVVASMFIGSML